MNNGWIKIHRKLLEWEWYDEPNTFRLFIHLLIKANHKPKSYRGVTILEGQVMTGQDLLAIQLKLTRSKIRVALNNLKTTNEITIKSSKQGSIIQLVKYKDYQVIANKSPSVSPDDNQAITTNKKYKELKEDKKSIFDSWLEYRISIKKEIKNIKTLEALINKFIEYDIDKIKYTVNASIENNYQGLFWDNYKPSKAGASETDSTILPYPEIKEFMLFIRDNCRIQKEVYDTNKRLLELKHDYYIANGWINWKGKVITDWKVEVLDNINHWIKL